MSTLKVNSIQHSNGTDALTIDSTGHATFNKTFIPANPLTNRNLIINGDMRIDQRNVGSAVTSASNVYLTDRWQLQINGTTNTPSFQQVTDAPTGFQYSLKATSNGSETLPTNGAVTPRQRIEGFNSAHLLYGTSNAKTVTISFWVKSSLSGTWTFSLANNAFDRSYVAEYTITSANTWEYKTVTITGDTAGTWNTDNTTGLIVQFPVDTDTILEATPNAWLAGNYRTTSGSNRLLGTSGATWQVTGIQLEVGDTATPFEHRPYDMELARCQRYYNKNLAVYTATLGGVGYNQSTTTARFYFPFPVTMRDIPSSLEQTGTASDYSIRQGGGAIACNGVPQLYSPTPHGADVAFFVSSGLTSGQGVLPRVNGAGGAYLAWSAEL
jgi:hypothetical protein